MVGFGSCREQDFQFCLLFQQRLDFHKRARTDLVANFTSGDFDLGPDSNKLLIRFESKLLELVKMDFTMLQSVFQFQRFDLSVRLMISFQIIQVQGYLP